MRHFESHWLTYEKKCKCPVKSAMLLITMLWGLGLGQAQEIIVSGRLLNATDTTEAVAYAAIGLKNTSIGTVSNEEGKFSLVIKNPTGYDTIVVYHLNFRRQEFTLRQVQIAPHSIFLLKPKELVLNEIIVSAIPLTTILERVIEESSKRATVPITLNT